MRIGTWNTAGHFGPGWEEFLLDRDCDVWLLTEVNEATDLPRYHRHLGGATMAARRRWAGVLSRRELTPLDDPHVASAAAEVGGVTFVSTVLPWRSSGGEPTWPGAEPPRDLHSGRIRHALTTLLAALPAGGLVWGGDWNHALDGPETAGTVKGRAHVQTAVDRLHLKVPTTWTRHRLGGLSIDHVAVPSSWSVRSVEHVDATGLSDHDCYVVEVFAR